MGQEFPRIMYKIIVQYMIFNRHNLHGLAILLYVPLDLEQQKYIFLVLQVQVFKTKYATYI